jgi:methylase of polypeptide subunit release factors
MTINEINKILAQLAENPSRENVLDFAFALLQWMNIEPNAQQKPQLLSPQTQKLKDFLAPAPQTVQPQLYRLSADNQNIRVRFAVLKKLKKDYISQLVDNDPGLSSYQSFIKGITANGSGFVPTQPYFIHFVTTPDYDKLVLIFNQGEQKRIVSFRRRLTTTQYNKIIQQWQGIGSKTKPEIADLLWKSLDIKEVNKEFYKQVKERFDALLGIVKTQHTTATENQVKQFTVRLIGRYIFCWFLKEKGIIAHSLIGKKNIEETDNYYQNVLLKLFFETLNTKVQDRNPITHNKLFEKIPYLNGGLFDESEEDKLFTDLQLDAWLLPFVEILESYDFTVDESSSQYQQVAVDPEMLGRIFENLLASQNEETEKLANQRKAFGAFYTPREIVDYMVNESIKAYLQTQWEQHIVEQKTKTLNNPEPVGDIFGNKKPQQLAIETKRYELKAEEKNKIEKAIEPLFAANPDAGQLKKEEKTLLLQFLEQIKILDPACGSGAFPMGILHKLVELHETLGTVKSPYELKKDILSQNIYGVDIMPMAIEIARLRAWLSLILEENYNPKDPVHNFGVKPLPNLDFKFVCANSLIDLGLDAFIQDSKGTLHEGFTQKLVTQLKELENLRKQFFTPALGSSEKEQLKADYFAERDKVVAAIEADSDPVLKAIAQKIKHWNPFDDSQPSPFFSPTWMFGIDKGFDVIIGNPPYGVSIKGEYRNIVIDSLGKVPDYEIYYYFIELGRKWTGRNTHCSYIIPNSILFNVFASNYRKQLIENWNIKEILDCTNFDFFEGATVRNIIFIFNSNGPSVTIGYRNNVGATSFSDLISNPRITLRSDDILLFNQNWGLAFKLEKDVSDLIIKIKKKSKPLAIYFPEMTQGLIAYDKYQGQDDETIKNRIYHFDKKVNSRLKPWLWGEDVTRYEVNWNGKEWIDYSDGIANPRRIEFFTRPRILIREITNPSIFAAYTEDEFYNDPAIINILEGKEIGLKAILAILNSRLASFLHFNNSPKATKGAFPKILVEDIKQFPIPDELLKKQKEFIDRVEKILSLKSKNQDTTTLEREIDVLVYKLYELTYDEVRIIDKDFWLSEEEYGKVKVGEK